MNRYKLTRAGVDVGQGLKRMGNDKDFYEELLSRFCDDEHYDQLKQAMEHKNTTEAFHQAHTLKGIAGNLSFVRLQDALTPLVEELRNGCFENALAYFPAVTEAYEILMGVLKSN